MKTTSGWILGLFGRKLSISISKYFFTNVCGELLFCGVGSHHEEKACKEDF